MTNNYVQWSESNDPKSFDIGDRQKAYRTGEFLRRNHHLISPWMYTAEQYKTRNHALFLMHFDVAQKELAPDAGEGEV